ncbi:MAG: hypothetical protein VKJ02_12495 [Snowella sp.]|nr:hypothetical protein [Snowella sp.]
MATTADEVWQLLGELIQSQKETERRFRETENLLQEQSQETERLLKEQSQKTDEQIRTINQQLNEQLGKLGNRLGEFVEWQIRPAAVRLFRERGIDVSELSSDLSVQKGDDGLEIDLLVVNGSEAIAIEVKSKLTKQDVDEHLERLDKFKKLLPRYQNLKILGAVAAMVAPSEVARYAYRQGLFVIAQSGDNLAILNDPKFKPKAW